MASAAAKTRAAQIKKNDVVREAQSARSESSNGAKAPGNPGLGTSRGVESMFRNAYRAQLDMIALAATKANIMISVNASVLALLTLSSAYIFTNEPRLLIPTIVFLLSCIVSMFFAVLAARPHRAANKPMKLDDFRQGRADLLVFEDFAQLPKDVYKTAMMELIQDNERVYKSMVAHLYGLGASANRRFKLLHVSYSTFIVGLIASALILAAVVVWRFS